MTTSSSRPVGGAGLEEHDVLVGGRALRVVRRPASGPGPRRTPLLLCNGIGAATDVLDPLVAALPADLDVIRFDPPGIGGSGVCNENGGSGDVVSSARRPASGHRK